MNPTIRLDDPLIGQVVYGGFMIERKLGEGGMGVVYAALDRDLDKRIAVKVLLPSLSSSSEVVSRFLGEAKAASRIGHDNIVRIEAKGTLPDGRAYVAMEYLDGVGLDAYLERHGALAISHALPMLMQIGAALGAAHARGIVHRDIKPPNIFVTHKTGAPVWIKVLDFGIARFMDPRQAGGVHTREGVVIGTPAFMPPEQAVGSAQIDHRADIYALGVLAHLMVTGSLPQRDASGVDWRSPRELAPALPPAWCDAILWAIRFHAGARPARVEDWIQTLVAATPEGVAIAETVTSMTAALAPISQHPTPIPTTLGTAAGSLATPPRHRRRGVVYVLTVAVAAAVAFAIPMVTRESDEAAPTVVPASDVRADAAIDAAADRDATADPAARNDAGTQHIDAAIARADAGADASVDLRRDVPRKKRVPKSPARTKSKSPEQGTIPESKNAIVE